MEVACRVWRAQQILSRRVSPSSRRFYDSVEGLRSSQCAKHAGYLEDPMVDSSIVTQSESPFRSDMIIDISYIASGRQRKRTRWSLGRPFNGNHYQKDGPQADVEVACTLWIAQWFRRDHEVGISRGRMCCGVRSNTEHGCRGCVGIAGGGN